jgi:DNA-binding CsgD family transcriptional regulator
VEALFATATRALCEGLGFGRAAVFSLDGGALLPESVHPSGLDQARQAQLGPGLRETEVLRRRTTVLIQDAVSDPRAIGLLAGTVSCVLAPITFHELCVGVIHADRGSLGEPLTERERATLAVFAEGLGCALERCVLAGRLRAQTEHLLALVRSTEQSVAELGRDEFALGSATARLEPVTGSNGSGLHGLLTRRELEVVAMLAEGETNARIAQRLVVSEDTVKSHVKHILRKLGVHNRSQAVSRYFHAQAVG